MAAQYDFTFDSDADVVVTLTWKDDTGNPIDLTGCTAIMTIIAPGSAPDQSYTQTSGLTLGGTAGTIAFDIPATVTSLWSTGVTYTLFVTSTGGIVTKLLFGSFVKES